MIDDKNYTVVGINGYRQGNLTREQAVKLARKMQDQMDRAGWRGKMWVYYRDGSPVDWRHDDSVFGRKYEDPCVLGHE
ncbi:MAG: hypothetical protein ACE5F6_00475 [Anaerolineae bacterium]